MTSGIFHYIYLFTINLFSFFSAPIHSFISNFYIYLNIGLQSKKILLNFRYTFKILFYFMNEIINNLKWEFIFFNSYTFPLFSSTLFRNDMTGLSISQNPTWPLLESKYADATLKVTEIEFSCCWKGVVWFITPVSKQSVNQLGVCPCCFVLLWQQCHMGHY